METQKATISRLTKKIFHIEQRLNEQIAVEDDPERRELLNGKVLAYSYVLHLIKNGIPVDEIYTP